MNKKATPKTDKPAKAKPAPKKPKAAPKAKLPPPPVLTESGRQRQLLRSMVRGAYDLQKIRIEQGNRLVAQFKSKLGHRPGTKEVDSIDEEGQDVIKDLKASFKILTEGVARELPKKEEWKGDNLIATFAEACLLHQYLVIEKAESAQFRRLETLLEEFPIYTEFLQQVKGCGPAMSAVIISEIDISKAQYVSSLWKFCGLDVVTVNDEGQGRGRRKEHLRTIQYIDKDGKEAQRPGITFNAFLKTKMMGVLATCLIKANSDPYRKVYDDYKVRLENHPKWKDRSKGHRHNASMRYMVKNFLMNLYAKWRPLEGLEAHPPYHEAKLGIIHLKTAA